MRAGCELWAGVDVGGVAKGFDAAVVDESRLVAGPHRLPTVEAAVSWLASFGPALVAIDSPIGPAAAGQRWRECELALRRDVCGIRWTPSLAAMERQRGYYGWVLHGLELYRALGGAGIPTVECFPTASWTRWAGARSRGTTRAAWTSSALTALDLDNLPARTNQDQRDAIAAAVTARLHAEGRTERFGDIVVPLPSRWLAGARGAVGDGRGRA